PLPFRAAGREVITLDRIQTPRELCSVSTLRIPSINCQCRQSHSFTSDCERRITAPLRQELQRFMDANGGIELTLLQGAPREARVDLFEFTTFGDPSKDSFFKSIDSALNGVLSDVAKSESFEGKTGQSIVIHTHGRIPAKRILLVGSGGRSESANDHIRDMAATIAQTANKASAAEVGFVLPAVGGGREQALA